MQARRCSLLILIATCLSAFTDQQIETAHQWALKTKDALVACWQQEVQAKLAAKMKPEDFALYAKGACNREAQDFRVPFVDYLAMKFPDVDNATHLAQVADTIEQWRSGCETVYRRFSQF
jgi:hypothetical protein